MLRLQGGRAVLAIAALSLMAPTATVDAAELPEGVDLRLNPNPLRPGAELTVSGNAIPGAPVCLSAQLRLTPTAGSAPVEYAFGGRFEANGPWAVRGTKLTRFGVAQDFMPGDYRIAIECFDNTGNQNVLTTTQTLTVAVDAPTTSSSSVPASSSSSSSSIASSSSSSTVGSSSSSSSSIASSSSSVPSTTSSTVAPGIEGRINVPTAKPTKTMLILEGGGFAGGTELRIALSTAAMELGTTKSSPLGFYATSLTLPANAPPGEHEITVTGAGAAGKPRTTTVAVTIEDLSCEELTEDQAQAALGPDRADPHGLDFDDDGRACQSDEELTSLSAGDGGRSAGGGARSSAASGSLPRTGTGRAPGAAMAGMTATVFGALLVGLSQPVLPVSAAHRRPRGAARRRRRGNHFGPPPKVAADRAEGPAGRSGPAAALRRIRRAS